MRDIHYALRVLNIDREGIKIDRLFSIDLKTRLEVQDLVSRFCHALDHNMPTVWASLFSIDAYVDAPRLGYFSGREEISRIPEIVNAQGGGAWRHYLNNIYMDLTDVSHHLRLAAYCMVSDWRKDGHVVRCWDFNAVVGKRNGWKILSLSLKPVTGSGENKSKLDRKNEVVHSV